MAAAFPDGIHVDGSVYPIVPGGYAVVGEFFQISSDSVVVVFFFLTTRFFAPSHSLPSSVSFELTATAMFKS